MMISENAQLKRLASAVVLQAVTDLKNKKAPARAVTALLWLTDPRSDFSLYKEVLGAWTLDPFKMLTSGNARRLRGRVRGSA